MKHSSSGQVRKPGISYFFLWHESTPKYFHILCLFFEEFHVRFLVLSG